MAHKTIDGIVSDSISVAVGVLSALGSSYHIFVDKEHSYVNCFILTVGALLAYEGIKGLVSACRYNETSITHTKTNFSL